MVLISLFGFLNIHLNYALFTENQTCVEQNCSSSCTLDPDNLSVVGKCEQHLRSKNYSSFPIHDGYVTKRKKQAMPCESNAQPIADNSDTKNDQNSVVQCRTDEVLTADETGNQMDPNVISHTDPLHQPENKSAQTHRLHFISDQKPEETVYDADMELTASELGEILTVKAKAKGKNSNQLKVDKISTNLRKTSIETTSEKNNNMPKKGDKKVSGNKKFKSISTTDSQQVQPQENERRNDQDMNSKSTNKHTVRQHSTYNKENVIQMHPVRFLDLNCQQTTRMLQKEKQKTSVSKTIENPNYQAPEEDLTASGNIVPVEDNRNESSSPVENCISYTASKQCLLEKDTTKQTMKNITGLATHIINQSNYCEIKNGQDLRRNLKELGSNERRPDCQTNQGKNITMKSHIREADFHCNLTSEITTPTLDVLSTEQVNEVLSQDHKRRIFAKASRKTCIIHTDSLKQKKLTVKQNLHNENVPHVDVTQKKAEKIQKSLDGHSATPTGSLKEAELDGKTFKRIDPIQKPRRKTLVCSSSQDKSKECIISSNAETTTEVHNIKKNNSVWKNTEGFQRTNQEKNECAPTEKIDVICKEYCKIPDFGTCGPVNSFSFK